MRFLGGKIEKLTKMSVHTLCVW